MNVENYSYSTLPEKHKQTNKYSKSINHKNIYSHIYIYNSVVHTRYY